ncbi:carboxypeptidase-like regulatory domain-containing protein [Bacteroidota bacterium]
MNIKINRRLSLLILITLLTFTSTLLFSQTGSLRGFVYNKETGEPVIFTNVYLSGTIYGAATDVNGFYTISKIPVGDYQLKVTFMGYDTLQMPVKIEANKIKSQDLYLSQKSVTLQTVNVSAERQEARTETRTSVINITPKQINKLPSIGGQPDLAQYLQVLPGVIFTGDQGGQLYIRGGSPVQNKVLLDGMIIYNPFHSIGLFSVFETDIIRNADVYTGGFGAEYSNSVSSVMDITTRDGNRKRISGKFGASTFGARLILEGPLIKPKSSDKGGMTFVLSAKNSYLGESSKIFYEYVDKDGLPFNFLDLYGKISLYGANGTKVNFFGFHFDDEVKGYKSLADFNWKSYGGGANFLVIPGKSPVLLEGHIAYSQYKISMSDEIFSQRTSYINNFSVGMDFTYFLGKDELKYGIEMLGYKTYLDFTNEAGIRSEIPADFTTQLGFYLKYKKIIGKVIIEPSVRMQWYATKATFSPEPRLAMKYNATDRFRVKLAGGYYSQSVVSGKSDRDVVNLFNSYITDVTDYDRYFDGKQIKNTLQKAQHAILGFEVDVTRNITVNLEGYYKNFSQIFNFNRDKVFNTDPDFIVEKGVAKGIDFTLKYDKNNFYVWAVYSLGFVDRTYENSEGELQTYYPHYDRRHNVNLVGTYRFGERKSWEVSARWNFGTGFPFTQNQGFYEKLPFQDGIYTDYTTTNGDMAVILAELNKERMPDYHRLDFDIKKKFVIGDHAYLEANFSLTNVYNQKNIFYVNRFKDDEIYQLPIMPSLGFTLSF